MHPMKSFILTDIAELFQDAFINVFSLVMGWLDGDRCSVTPSIIFSVQSSEKITVNDATIFLPVRYADAVSLNSMLIF